MSASQQWHTDLNAIVTQLVRARDLQALADEHADILAGPERSAMEQRVDANIFDAIEKLKALDRNAATGE